MLVSIGDVYVKLNLYWKITETAYAFMLLWFIVILIDEIKGKEEWPNEYNQNLLFSANIGQNRQETINRTVSAEITWNGFGMSFDLIQYFIQWKSMTGNHTKSINHDFDTNFFLYSHFLIKIEKMEIFHDISK